MLSLHHTHLFASDVDRSIAFWRDHFGAVVLVDTDFAGARNVFMGVGEGRLHLYAQAPRHVGAGTVHHLGIETDELDALVGRLKAAGVSVTDVRRHAEGDYAMAEGPGRESTIRSQPGPHRVAILHRPEGHEFHAVRRRSRGRQNT